MDALTLLLVLLLVAASSGGPPARGLPNDRVLLIGDSLGVGLGPPLGQLATAARVPFQNISIGGTVIRQWAGSAKLGAALADFRPSLVLVSLGTNDAGMSAPESESADLAALLARLRAGGRRVVWLLPPKLPARYKADRVRAMVTATGVATFDSRRLDIPQFDGIHATPAGYRSWAAAIWKAIGG